MAVRKCNQQRSNQSDACPQNNGNNSVSQFNIAFIADANDIKADAFLDVLQAISVSENIPSPIVNSGALYSGSGILKHALL